MKILGITAPVSWNNAAAVVVDGRLVAAAEEERFVRLKHSPHLPPVNAMTFCLKEAGLRFEEIDCIAVGWRGPGSFFVRALTEEIRNGRLKSATAAAAAAMDYGIQLLKMRAAFRRQFGDAGILTRKIPWMFVPHHMAHAASAYFVSGFPQAAIMTLDGNGEDDAGMIGKGEGLRIQSMDSIRPQDSLGVLYGKTTNILGFKEHSHEGKTMGLAAWGRPTDSFDDFMGMNHARYSLRPDYLPRLEKKYGPRRAAHEPLSQKHKDLAASVQAALERAGVSVLKQASALTGLRKFCFAGGVALNCDMNAKLLEQPEVEDLFVQPAAHDAGVSLGAAYCAAAHFGDRSTTIMSHAAWGPGYTDESIESFLKEAKIPYVRCQDIADTAADLLAKGKIVGWFQGRMEWGPRALGHRSILAHPGRAEMKDKVNVEVKHRETWRPFAPSILHEAGSGLVEKYRWSPFMLLTFVVKPDKRSDLAAALHVDSTVRLQSVTREADPLYHRLIERFRDRTSIPAVLNTSYNDEGEPLVMSPRDAVRTFYTTGLDALAIGSFLLLK